METDGPPFNLTVPPDVPADGRLRGFVIPQACGRTSALVNGQVTSGCQGQST
jgi:hypothetical protein